MLVKARRVDDIFPQTVLPRKSQSLEAEPKRSPRAKAREAWSCWNRAGRRRFYELITEVIAFFEPFQCAWHMDVHWECFHSTVLYETPMR